MSNKQSNTMINATKELIESDGPSAWINWLFDIQNLLIAAGHCESLSRKGSEDFSTKFATLKCFFQDLQQVETAN